MFLCNLDKYKFNVAEFNPAPTGPDGQWITKYFRLSEGTYTDLSF
jgi:hypothetical protein